MDQAHTKLAQGVMRSLSHAAPEQQISVIVRYRVGRETMRHAAPMRGVRYGYHYRLNPLVQMQATAEGIATLEDDPDVVYVYEDRKVFAYLDTSVPLIQADRLYNEEGLTGDGVRVAVIDTGIDQQHPDLVSQIAAVQDFTGEGPDDLHGHGTHCAGVVAGTGQASGGRYRGVAPGARIYAAKVLGTNGEGMMSDVMAGIEWAVAQNVQVISLSLGGFGPCDGSDALCQTCEAAVRAGVTVCVAAGNEGPGPRTVGSPGCAENVITIGACNDLDQVAYFSSRGPTLDGRVKPDVLLPGVSIVAARAKDTSMDMVVDEYYVAASGTSMAAPHAAGVCALLLQALPESSPAQIKERLMTTALNVSPDRYAQGSGRADAWRARHDIADPQPDPEPTPPAQPPEPGQGCLVAMVKLLFMGRALRKRLRSGEQDR